MESLNLFQQNSFKNFYDNVLDLCFSNLKCNISLVLEEFLFPDIAHPVIDLQIFLPPTLLRSDIMNPVSYDYYKFDFKSANYNVINNKLSCIDWYIELNSLSIIDATNKFYSIISTIIDNEVPKKRFKLSTFSNWFSSKVIDLIFQKKESHRNYKMSLDNNNPNNVEYFKSLFFHLRKQCKLEAKKLL